MKSVTELPNDTVVDGEIVALDENGKPSFNLLQAFGSAHVVVFYAFDVLMLRGKDVRLWQLDECRDQFHHLVLTLPDTIRYSETFERADFRIDAGCQ